MLLDAVLFVDCVRFPYEDSVRIRNSLRVQISKTEEAQLYDVGRKATFGKILDYRIMVVTSYSSTNSFSSKLYIRWPDLDLDMRIYDAETDPRSTTPSLCMAVKLDNIATPTYHSDVREQPAVDHAKIARFKTALQLRSSAALTFTVELRRSLLRPPEG